MAFLAEFGYLGLLIAALLAATVLPLSSEVVLSVLLLNGLSPSYLVLVATLGNVLGALINYALGYWAGDGKIQQWFKVSDVALLHAQQRFEK